MRVVPASLLFACSENAIRSPMAEALARRLYGRQAYIDSVGVRAGAASFKQIDKSLDEASTMLRAGTATTLRRVVLPLLKPAVVAALVYSFVRSMTTVSAVIFLVTAETELATTYIIGRVGNGDYGVALAYCTVLIAAMSLATALIQALVGERKLGRRAVGA